MDVVFVVNGMDMHGLLASYKVTREVSYKKVLTTLDGVEHPIGGATRTLIDFSLLPVTDAQNAEIYKALSGLLVQVTFTDPYAAKEVDMRMRVASDLEAAFGLRSIDGNRYYAGETIQLRQR